MCDRWLKDAAILKGDNAWCVFVGVSVTFIFMSFYVSYICLLLLPFVIHMSVYALT